MFTGLVQRTGTLSRIVRPGGGAALRVGVGSPWPDGPLAPGESVAVQGVCLTVATALAGGGFVADVLEETLDRTAFAALPDGARVNLERALRAGDRLGGHLVQGHVDGVGRVAEIRPRAHDVVLRIAADAPLLEGVVWKGSVAVDGTSLTVSALSDEGGWFEVNLIPTTLRGTSLGDRRAGDPVNVETDVVGKYVARLMGAARRAGAGGASGNAGEASALARLVAAGL